MSTWHALQRQGASSKDEQKAGIICKHSFIIVFTAYGHVIICMWSDKPVNDSKPSSGIELGPVGGTRQPIEIFPQKGVYGGP